MFPWFEAAFDRQREAIARIEKKLEAQRILHERIRYELNRLEWRVGRRLEEHNELREKIAQPIFEVVELPRPSLWQRFREWRNPPPEIVPRACLRQ